jgi:hypothetical protein
MPFPISQAPFYIKYGRPLSGQLVMVGMVFWIVAYVFVIRRGVIDSHYGVPLVAICMNITWEFYFAVQCPLTKRAPRQPSEDGCPEGGCPPQAPPAWAIWIQRAWLVLDVLILIQLMQYGPLKYDDPQTHTEIQYYFVPIVIGCLILAYIGQVAFMRFNSDVNGNKMAWISNFTMSSLFVLTALARDDVSKAWGLSYPAAWLKMLGSALIAAGMIRGRTLAVSHRNEEEFHFARVDGLMYFLFVSVFALDAFYIWLFHNRLPPNLGNVLPPELWP